jgi:hypothetical protein
MAAYTTIDDSSEFFQTALYTGNGSSQNITNDGNSDLQPDFLWTKERTNGSTNHVLANSNLGWNAPKGEGYPWENGPFGGQMDSSSTGAESTPAATYGYASAALTDGFTVSAGGSNADNCNKNNAQFVAWQWKSNGGTKANNDSGNIVASVQANTTSRFSIVTYTGNGATGQAVRHGLGATPTFFIIKRRDGAADWFVYHQVLGNTKHVHLNKTDAVATTSDFGNYGPDVNNFYVNNTGTCINNEKYIAYCFADVQGYSKFGSYTGNGNANGAFVYTGFKPAFLMWKITSNNNWRMVDTKRGVNGAIPRIKPNANSAEGSAGDNVDLLSNGFKFRSTASSANTSGASYIYIAFAENPFVTSTGVPATAR